MVQKVFGVLTFDDSSEVGACAVGGEHDHKRSYIYVLVKCDSGFEGKEIWRWY